MILGHCNVPNVSLRHAGTDSRRRTSLQNPVSSPVSRLTFWREICERQLKLYEGNGQDLGAYEGEVKDGGVNSSMCDSANLDRSLTSGFTDLAVRRDYLHAQKLKMGLQFTIKKKKKKSQEV